MLRQYLLPGEIRKKEYKSRMGQNGMEKRDKIVETCLLEEILIAMRDCFCCTMVQQGGRALLTFENGKRFLLAVREVPPGTGAADSAGA